MLYNFYTTFAYCTFRLLLNFSNSHDNATSEMCQDCQRVGNEAGYNTYFNNLPKPYGVDTGGFAFNLKVSKNCTSTNGMVATEEPCICGNIECPSKHTCERSGR